MPGGSVTRDEGHGAVRRRKQLFNGSSQARIQSTGTCLQRSGTKERGVEQRPGAGRRDPDGGGHHHGAGQRADAGQETSSVRSSETARLDKRTSEPVGPGFGGRRERRGIGRSLSPGAVLSHMPDGTGQPPDDQREEHSGRGNETRLGCSIRMVASACSSRPDKSRPARGRPPPGR